MSSGGTREPSPPRVESDPTAPVDSVSEEGRPSSAEQTLETLHDNARAHLGAETLEKRTPPLQQAFRSLKEDLTILRRTMERGPIEVRPHAPHLRTLKLEATPTGWVRAIAERARLFAPSSDPSRAPGSMPYRDASAGHAFTELILGQEPSGLYLHDTLGMGVGSRLVVFVRLNPDGIYALRRPSHLELKTHFDAMAARTHPTRDHPSGRVRSLREKLANHQLDLARFRATPGFDPRAAETLEKTIAALERNVRAAEEKQAGPHAAHSPELIELTLEGVLDALGPIGTREGLSERDLAEGVLHFVGLERMPKGARALEKLTRMIRIGGIRVSDLAGRPRAAAATLELPGLTLILALVAQLLVVEPRRAIPRALFGYDALLALKRGLASREDLTRLAQIQDLDLAKALKAERRRAGPKRGLTGAKGKLDKTLEDPAFATPEVKRKILPLAAELMTELEPPSSGLGWRDAEPERTRQLEAEWYERMAAEPEGERRPYPQATDNALDDDAELVPQDESCSNDAYKNWRFLGLTRTLALENRTARPLFRTPADKRDARKQAAMLPFVKSLALRSLLVEAPPQGGTNQPPIRGLAQHIGGPRIRGPIDE